TPDDFGTRLRRMLGSLLEFVFFVAVLLVGFASIDRYTKHSSASRSWSDRIVEALFVAGLGTLAKFGNQSLRKTVEIGDDHMTIYEGAEVDPLFRHGQTILRAAVSDVREGRFRLFSLLGPRPCGLMVRYGRSSRWTGKRLFIPAGIQGYEEIKVQLFGWG